MRGRLEMGGHAIVKFFRPGFASANVPHFQALDFDLSIPGQIQAG
jgi:hypothetical protein